ncbi:MAG: hypothetical protein U0271_10695 [Polyangiaceae bacterium]
MRRLQPVLALAAALVACAGRAPAVVGESAASPARAERAARPTPIALRVPFRVADVPELSAMAAGAREAIRVQEVVPGAREATAPLALVERIDMGTGCAQAYFALLGDDARVQPIADSAGRAPAAKVAVAQFLSASTWSAEHLDFFEASGPREPLSCSARVEPRLEGTATALVPGLVYAFRRPSADARVVRLAVVAPPTVWATTTAEPRAARSGRFTVLEAELQRGAAASMALSMTSLAADLWLGKSSPHSAACDRLDYGDVHVGVELTWGSEELEPLAALTVRFSGRLHPHVRSVLPKAP